MRVDVVSIFPEYLAPLGLSLPGKAQEAGLLDLHVHDLRRWAHDRHRTVDDTPYGGGAGMVMKPEPWGEALDTLAGDRTVLVVPTPSGERFTQATAAELAGRERLLFACGRYEGIDQRVVDHARTRMEVREISLGDYVLNGGEVAALVVIEAVVRLLPGFLGNPASLVEESHGEGGLLEYPVYTKPASWRGLDVPDVLLSGDHARIAAWRHAQAVRRTAERRPDLLPVTATLAVDGDPVTPTPAVPADAGELWTLQRACWAGSAQPDVPPLTETRDDVRVALDRGRTYVLRVGGRVVAAVRAGRDEAEPATWRVDRLMVAPDLQGRGLGRGLLAFAESRAPDDVGTFALTAGAVTSRALRKAGYRPAGESAPGSVALVKRRRQGAG